MQIELDLIRRVLTILLRHLEEQHGNTIKLDKDFYWNVGASQIYNPYEKPVELTIGQLSECLSELQQIVEGKREALTYSFVWVAAILRAIGDLHD